MNTSDVAVRTIDLEHEQMLLIEAHPPVRVKVLFGGVWLTEQGRIDDAFLAAGDEITLRGRGLSIAEALSPARLQVVERARRTDRHVRAVRQWLADRLQASAAAVRPA